MEDGDLRFDMCDIVREALRQRVAVVDGDALQEGFE